MYGVANSHAKFERLDVTVAAGALRPDALQVVAADGVGSRDWRRR